MSTTTPSWTDSGSALIASLFAAGGLTATTLDLQGKFGAWVYVQIGRLESDAVDSPAEVSVCPSMNAGAILHPDSTFTRVMNENTADGLSTIDQNSNSGTRTVFVAATTNFAVGDVIHIGAGDGTNGEFAVVTAIDAGVSLTVRDELQLSHTSGDADTVSNEADVFGRMFVPGGAIMDVVANYEVSAAGPDLFIRVYAQTLDSMDTV